MNREDYYEALGLKRGSNADEIRKAYRRLARRYHPDLNPGDRSAEERFKAISKAYDVLGDAKKRKIYDQYGFYSDQVPPEGPTAQAGPGFPGFGFSGFDFSNFDPAGERHRGGGSSFRDLFSQFFSRGSARGASPSAPRQGKDIEYPLRVAFWDAVEGKKARITVSRQEVCPACSGTGSGAGRPVLCPECNGTGSVRRPAGALQFTLACEPCGGSGRLSRGCSSCRTTGWLDKPESFEIRIPAGVQTGSRIRLAGKGNSGIHGGARGDLYIITEVGQHPYFDRRGDNIYTRVPVTVSEAALGAKIEVPTVDGKAVLKVPPGTQGGQKFRLRGKGAPSLRSNLRGDHYVEVRVVVPRVADERTKEILRELSRLHPEDPRRGLKTEARGFGVT